MIKISIKTLLITFLISASALAIPLPYRQLNVNENYLQGTSYDNNRPIFSISNYLGKQPYALSSNNGIDNYFIVNRDLLFVNKNISTQEFNSLKKTCAMLDSDSNKLLCNLTISDASGQKGQLPVIIYNGLRTKNIAEVLSDRYQAPQTVNLQQPYYLEISAVPTDFNASTPIIDLHTYFTSTDNQENFQLDASNVTSNVQACTVKYITAIGKSSCAASLFKINSKGYLVGRNLSTGIYQINVAANENTETAYQTFYINVNTNNPDLSQWRQGAVAHTNVIGNFSSIYLYSGQDPDKQNGFPSDYQQYAQDLGQLNSSYLTAKPIKTVFIEIVSMLFPKDKSGWQLNMMFKNPELQIDDNGVTNDRPLIGNWINSLTQLYANKGIGVTLNYDFSNALKADFFTMNAKQQNIVAAAMVAPILKYKNLNGISMDLEGGFNQLGAAELYKKITDRLAYQGKWFSFYYFSDMFNPYVVASFGPLGVANISTYDVGQYRAPETIPIVADTKSYTATGFSNGEAAVIYAAFAGDHSCTATRGTNDQIIYMPISYCNLSLNDAYSENYRRFEGDYHQLSTSDAMLDFNGKYQLALPVAATATEWDAVEIWNPDFTPAKFGTGRIMTSKIACETVNNQFFINNATALSNKNSAAYQQLQQCLLNTMTVNSLPVQTFAKCSPTLPYSQCILISSLPGSITNTNNVIRSDELSYIKNNQLVYADSQSQQAGYSLFALENTNAAPAGAFGKSTTPNITVQEPWYVGVNPSKTNPDPYYNRQTVTSFWQQFGN